VAGEPGGNPPVAPALMIVAMRDLPKEVNEVVTMHQPLRRTVAGLVVGIAVGSALLVGQAAGHGGGSPLADNSGPVVTQSSSRTATS
jgi:hypothetical protein